MRLRLLRWRKCEENTDDPEREKAHHDPTLAPKAVFNKRGNRPGQGGVPNGIRDKVNHTILLELLRKTEFPSVCNER